jgi:hypothetical protein
MRMIGMTDLLLPPGHTVFAGPTVQTPLELPVSTSYLLVGVVERLHREFELIPLSAVFEVVSGCLRDIQTTSPGALPELTERLARQRLSEFGQQAAGHS